MSLTVASVGDGPDLALIHGWGLGNAAWNELLPRLTPHFRVHRVDLPGYGPAPGDAADEPRIFAATAAALAAVLPTGCSVCGWSLGALLALQASRCAPQRWARLILCGASPCFTQRADWPSAQPSTLLDGFQAALAGNAAATRQRFIALMNQGDSQARAITRTLTRALAGEAVAPDTGALRRGLDWLAEVDLRAQLVAGSPAKPRQETAPTLLVHGENDPLMPLAAAQWLAATLPEARLEVFAGAAHAPFANDPQRFVQLLIDFCHAPAL